MPVPLEIRQSVLPGGVFPRHQPAWQCVDRANERNTPVLGFDPLRYTHTPSRGGGGGRRGWNEHRLNKMVKDDEHYLASVILDQDPHLPPRNSSLSGPCLVQMFMPIFCPVVTGNPACSVLSSPIPFGKRFSQYTALPSMGLKVTPLSYGSSQSSVSHQRGSLGASSMGKFVPPPVVSFDTCTYAKKDDTRLPPRSAVA